MLREIIASQRADVALYGLVTGSARSVGMWIRHQLFASSGVIVIKNVCLQKLFKTHLYSAFSSTGCYGWTVSTGSS
jgi:hypothetical protein